MIIASVIFHEIGHAAALMKHKRVVGKLGAGVMLIFPAMFTEVLEHAIMSRKEKLWLNVAGVYFQTIVGHFVTLAGLLCHSRYLLDYAMVIYLIAFFQLLPLNGQDGVWLVSDLLETHGKLFRTATQIASIVIAGAIITPIATRSLMPYWRLRFDLYAAGHNPFAGNLDLNVHLSSPP